MYIFTVNKDITFNLDIFLAYFSVFIQHSTLNLAKNELSFHSEGQRVLLSSWVMADPERVSEASTLRLETAAWFIYT